MVISGTQTGAGYFKVGNFAGTDYIPSLYSDFSSTTRFTAIGTAVICLTKQGAGVVTITSMTLQEVLP